MITHINDSNFAAEVKDYSGLVLVDYFATWCGPCRAMAPALDELANEQASKVKVCKLDIEESPDATTEAGVMAVPTLVVYKGGAEVARATGAMSKQKLMELLGL